MTPLPSRSRNTAFSLIELLVVCAIIGVIIGFTIPAVTTMMRGSQLTQGSQSLSDQLSLARQLALTKNRPIEIRFYKFADPETPGEDAKEPGTWKYRAFQSFEVLDNGAVLPLGKIQILPNTVIMNEGNLSSLLDPDVRGEPKQPTSNDPEIPRISTKDVSKTESYVYQTLRFRQDGSTDLPSAGKAQWFITLHGINEVLPQESSKPPPNFFTLQIDPVSGATRSFRPNAG
ncbi:MAG TPA: Verru_Chthon cassette protein D [Chthoniobacteraceae bacterium]|nr:Verru_Chthon cassette protein D [Chthoniobacteraceae bacterium]